MSFRNLGTGDNRGIIWSEDQNLAFGLIYDGKGSGGNNRLHFRDMIGTQSDIMTIKNNGMIGIGVDNPDATLHIKDFAKLEPQAAPPDCTSTNHEGRVYFAQGTQKLRVCTSSGWINVH